MGSVEERPRGPGRPPRLSRAAVVDAAAAVVDRDGIDGLTMRRVAEELDSSPMALYRHVRDKDELLVALLDRLVERLPRPDLPEDPRDRILVAFGVIHDGLAASPWVVGLLAAGDLMAPSVAWLIEEIHAGLVACGLPAERAVAAYRALWQFTIGELTIRDAGARVIPRADRPAVQTTTRTEVDPEVFPTLAAVADHWAAARGRDTYTEDLAALLDGLIACAPSFAYRVRESR